MDNNLRNLEKDLRAFAKRNQNVTYTKGLLMTFLITGTISLSTWGAVDTVQAARQGVNVAVTDMRQTFSRAREENKALLKDANLELIQLMEQGDHVVKSPWSSWQFGINTFLNESRGSYKGRGDKKEKYPYEGAYRRSSDLLERGVSPISTQYSQVTKSSDRTYASTSGREGLNSSSYGLAGTKYVTEPIVGFEVNANVKPKQVAKSPITIAAKDVATPTLPQAIQFTPIVPNIPVINPPAVTIRTVKLASYANGNGPTVLGNGVNIPAGTHTVDATTPSGNNNAIVEYTRAGSFESDSTAIINVDLVGRRAVTLDPTGATTGNLTFENKGTINLLSNGNGTLGTGGIEVQTHSGTATVTGKNSGTINGKGTDQVAIIFTDEGASNGVYTLQNDGTINMEGNSSYGYGFGVTNGWTAKAINNKNVTLSGDNSYGMAIGTGNTVGAGSSLENNAGATINISGNNSGGMVVQSAIDIVKNDGTINITGGNNSFGIYTDLAGKTINNDGVINITGGNNNIGLRVGSATSTLVNKKDINISSTGVDNAGLYTENGTVKNDTGAKIEITAGENIGILNKGGTATNDGDIIANSDGSIGILSSGGTTTSTGSVTVTGGNNAAGTRGTIGFLVSGGTLTSTGTADIDVNGNKSVGMYSTSNLTVGDHTNKTTGGAVNYFADGNGVINLNGTTMTATTGDSSLLFYAQGNGKFNVTGGGLNATVSGGSNTPATRGTAFYVSGTDTPTLLANIGTAPSDATDYRSFGLTDIQNWVNTTFNGTQGNVNLTMDPNSRLFLADGVSTTLTAATPSVLNTSLGLNITGTNYRPFMLYHSLLTVETPDTVNLDSATDPYSLLEIANSSITNDGTMNGTQVNQVAMAQENDTFGTGTPSKGIVTLTNNGTINLSGTGSTAMYTDYGYLINNGTISVGDNSTAMYGLNDTEISNNTGATINLGSNSTAMYSKGATNVGLVNEGTISTAGDNSIAMAYEPATSGQTVENKGTITMTGDKNTGIYATDAQLEANSKALAAGTYTGPLPLTSATTYTAKNSGTITLGDSASLNNPNVGIYAKNENVTSENAGTITSGNNTVGIFGYAANNTGDITVGDNAIALYSKGGNINLNGGTITVGQGQAVGVYTEGTGQTITNNSTAFNIGDTSYGFVNVGTGNTINSNYTGTVNLVNDGVYIYTNDTTGTVNNHTNLFASGLNGRNYGIYGAGTINNWGNMDFRGGKGNIGVYSINGGDATNYGVIEIGQSNIPSGEYGVGMAAGYKGDATTPATTGKVTNKGIIRINEKYGIGLYATGVGSVATNDTGGVIELNADNTSGIYVENGANAINNGTITTGSVGGLKQVSGVVLGTGSTLTNNGTITIDATKGVGIYLKGGTVANYGTLNVTGSGSQAVYDYTNSSTGKTITVNGASVVGINAPAGATSATITANGNPVTPTMITTTNQNPTTVSANSIGMYVNTSGTAFTNPIGGLGALTNEADLIIGAEAGDGTNSKYIQINDPNILGPYNASIAANPQVTNWNVYSGSLTWLATVTLNNSTGSTQIGNIYMAKVPYTVFTTDTDTYNFADGLEQRYDMNALNSREKLLFNKLNSIGNNEEILLYQAYDEMMGHQYANAQQRINHTGNLLDKEFKYLYDQWETKSKQSNKLKVFGMRDEYNTDTAGIIDYTNNAYGVAYLHEDETVKLGDTTGWYAGAVHNRFRFKDIGGSKEEQTMLKAGIFKSTAFDDNNSLNWTIAGELFGGINEMRRRYLVVDDVFGAESKYYSYGVGLKNQISKTFRTGEKTFLKPYASLDMEYGRMTKIKEKTGEVRLEVGSNDYYSIKPELGVEFKYKTKFGKRSTFITSLGVAYENELGKVAGTNNKARVGYTNADWFNLRSEKDNRSGNFKADLNLGIENTRVGFTANLGYDTVGKNIRGGLGIRAIY